MRLFKLFLFSLVVLNVLSCTTSKNYAGRLIPIYAHPEHGIVSKNDAIYKSAEVDCENKVYINGVNVNGEIIKDREKLNEIRMRSATIFAARRKDSDQNSLVLAAEYAKEMPPYIVEINELDKIHERCMSTDMKFNKAGLGIYNPATRKVEKYNKKLAEEIAGD